MSVAPSGARLRAKWDNCPPMLTETRLSPSSAAALWAKRSCAASCARQADPDQVFATDRRADPVKQLALRHKLRSGTDNLEAARTAEVALVCLKPQHMEAALDNEPIRAALAGKLVISIAAGVRLGQLASWLPKPRSSAPCPTRPR